MLALTSLLIKMTYLTDLLFFSVFFAMVSFIQQYLLNAYYVKLWRDKEDMVIVSRSSMFNRGEYVWI